MAVYSVLLLIFVNISRLFNGRRKNLMLSYTNALKISLINCAKVILLLFLCITVPLMVYFLKFMTGSRQELAATENMEIHGTDMIIMSKFSKKISNSYCLKRMLLSGSVLQVSWPCTGKLKNL
ncbi:5-hydroxytryptamine receptor [Dirofilaria immitis]